MNANCSSKTYSSVPLKAAAAEQLWNSLLCTFLGDTRKLLRLVAYERERAPDAELKELLEAAIFRYRHDNRC